MTIESVSASVLDAGLLKSRLFSSSQASPLAHLPEFRSDRSWFWPSQKVVTRLSADGFDGVSVTSGGSVVRTIVQDHLAGLLTGRDWQNREEAWDLMFRSLVPFDRSGFAMMAIAAVDLALWDLAAAASSRTTADLIGGPPRQELPVYATTSNPDRLQLRDFSGVKIPLPSGPGEGRQGVANNIEALKRARSIIGHDRDLMVDIFLGWDLAFALEMMAPLTDHGVVWLEDALLPTELAGYEKLTRAANGRIKLALGNFCFSRWDCDVLLSAGVVSVLQPDIAWAGGLTEALRIVHLAARHDVPVIFHNGAEQPWALALSAVSPDIPCVEWVDRDRGSLLHDLFATAPEISGGRIQLKPESFSHTLSQAARGKLGQPDRVPVGPPTAEVS
jgi:L-rhamnonate dehydratase